MEIESELPEDFEQLSDEEKIEALEELKEGFDDDSDSGAIKKRMVEELILHYKD